MRLLSLLGASPGVLHTVLCLLLREGAAPEQVTVLATLLGVAEEALEIARSCPCPWTGTPPLQEGINVELITLPYSDVDTAEKARDLRRRVAELLTPDTVVDVTGGRKSMAVAAAVEAAVRGAPIIAAQLKNWEKYFKASLSDDKCGKTAPESAVLIKF